MHLYQRPIDIYRQLKADPFFTSRVGTIRLSTGVNAPAISVVPPFPDKDSVSVTGVSITLFQDPAKFFVDSDGGGASRYYRILVACNDEIPLTLSNYRAIVTRIQQRYPYKVRCVSFNREDSLTPPNLPQTEIFVYRSV